MARKTRLHVETLDDRIVPSFTPAVSYAAGTSPQAVVTADFNNDAILDLAVANTGDSTVSVHLGNADGTFQQATTPAAATGLYPQSIAVGDFDQDGNLDLATFHGGGLLVLMGDGMGHFEAPTSINLVGYGPPSVAVGDFNGDGLMDLGVVSSGYDGGYYAIASIHAGDGQGHFAEPKTTFINYDGFFSSATTVDLDGDGVDDLAATNNFNGFYSGSVVLLRGDVSGYFQSTLLFTDDNEYDVAVGDVNGDNVADVVAAGDGVRVMLGDGLGGYNAAQTYAVGTQSYELVLGDFTGDGNIDIAVSNSYSNGVSVLRGGGDGTFSPPGYSTAGSSPWGVAAGDYNGDGWLDIAVTNLGVNTVSVLINDQSWSGPPLPPPPSVSINDASVTEGNTGTVNATFTVTRTGDLNQSSTVAYATGNGTATAGSDFQTASGTLTFAPGETSKTITVTVLGDQMFEPTETFAIILSAPTNAWIVDGNGIGTIVNDDVQPTISIGDFSKAEGRGGSTLFTFTVTLSVASTTAVTVNYSTSNGTATGGEDYTAASGTLTFAPGETTKTITINVKGDRKRESNETFFVNLSGASLGVQLLDPQGIGTILNDD